MDFAINDDQLELKQAAHAWLADHSGTPARLEASAAKPPTPGGKTAPPPAALGRTAAGTR